MKLPPIQQRTVVVTGCSSGIGEATAHILRDRGWKVIPTARKAEDLERLRADGFTPVQLDVVDEASCQRAAQEAFAVANGPIGALVNNAGFGQAGAVEDLTRDVLQYQFDVNLIGMQSFTNRFLPAFRKQGYGRVVNISSVVGRISLPFYGSYSATKFAMEALSDAMRVELYGTGVGVILVEPGPIISKFRKNAAERAQSSLDLQKAQHASYYDKEIKRRIRQQKKPDFFTKPPESVAVKVVHALESGSPKRRYCVTVPAYLGAFLARFAPDALIDWALSRRMPAAKKV